MSTFGCTCFILVSEPCSLFLCSEHVVRHNVFDMVAPVSIKDNLPMGHIGSFKCLGSTQRKLCGTFVRGSCDWGHVQKVPILQSSSKGESKTFFPKDIYLILFG